MEYSEWFFTGKIYDHPAKDISCELCDHERLRYEHVIMNDKTKQTKSVGSSCILKFADIRIYDSNKQLVTNPHERKKVLKKAFEEFKFKLSLIPLRLLYKKTNESDQGKIKNIVEFAKKKNGITPNDLIWLFLSMKNKKIEYNPGLYKIFLRDVSSQIDLKMAVKHPNKLELIFHAMSASQKKTCGVSEIPAG